MIRSAAVLAIIALASSAPLASALQAPPEYCCACPQGGPVNSTASAALFCLTSNNGDSVTEAGRRCGELTGRQLICVADGDGSCHDDLAGIGITCPTTGAPAAGGASLLSLVVVLGAGGAFALRRRRRRIAIAVER